MESLVKPVRLTPSMREKVWGRTRLSPYFPDAAVPIGEVWYESRYELPLLVKLLFTSDRLSVQLHPDDGESVSRGKTEMWHILEAEAGAAIALGFRAAITRDRLLHSSRTGEVEELLNWIPVHPGETYFVPAHTVHAIGAGIVLCEIQQNSDVTYRLWDYGRPRELHLDEAIPLADLSVHPGAADPVARSIGRDELVRSRHFITELVRIPAGDSFQPPRENCHLVIVLQGCGSFGDQAFRPFEVWLLPESGDQPEIRATDSARLLRSWVPTVEQR